MERMLFSSDVTKLRSDAQNLQTGKKNKMNRKVKWHLHSRQPM